MGKDLKTRKGRGAEDGKKKRKEEEEEEEEEGEDEDPGDFVEGWVLRTPKTPKDWVRRWAINSSANGIPNVQRSRHTFRRMFWLIIVFAGTALTLKDVVSTFQQYFSYPINVVLRKELQTGLEFPAVTICNLNPVRRSKLYLAGKEFEERLLEASNPENVIGVNSREQEEAQEYFHNKFSQLNGTIQHEMGHQIEDMLMGCKFAKKNCSAAEFYPFLDASYGNCFTFNSERDKNKTRIVHRAGPKHGLTVDLYIQPQEYVSLLTEAVGMRISVDNPEAMPFPDDTGVYISPGQNTGIEVRKIEVLRKPSPFPSNCWEIEEDDAVGLSVYSQVYGYDYSEQACVKTCYQKHVIWNCSCGDPTIPLKGEAFGNDKPGSEPALPCLTEEEEICEEEIKELASAGKLNCNCSVECKAISFNPTVSSALWPSGNLTNAYKERLKMLHPDDPLGYSNPRETIARVQVFYPEMEAEFIEEQEAYSSTNLYSDLGGNVGFYLGLSIISLFEFFELIHDLIRSCYRGARHKRKVKKHESVKMGEKRQNGKENGGLGERYMTDYYQ